MNSTSSYCKQLAAKQDPKRRLRQIITESRTFGLQYKVLGIMYQSANGTLLSAIQLSTRRRVVVKLISKNVPCENIDGRPVPLEIALHQKVNGVSPYIIELIGWYERRSDFVIILDYGQRELNLVEYVAAFGPLSTSDSLSVAQQLAKAADSMLKYGVCHRDLKHENVLIDYKTLQIKIIDFGCAQKITSRSEKFANFAGTIEFTPPEFFAFGCCEAEKSTVYSIGLITYFISFCKIDQLRSSSPPPSPPPDVKAPGAEISSLRNSRNLKSQRLHELIRNCILDEKNRVNLSDIINCHFSKL